MEIGPWVEHAQAIWNVLPVHPRPQPLESMTGYIIRLAEANGLKSIHELGALAGGIRFNNLKSPDYPASAFPGLAHIASVPAAGWRDMTFFHLVQRFGRSMQPVALHKFLAGSLS